MKYLLPLFLILLIGLGLGLWDNFSRVDVDDSTNSDHKLPNTSVSVSSNDLTGTAINTHTAESQTIQTEIIDIIDIDDSPDSESPISDTSLSIQDTSTNSSGELGTSNTKPNTSQDLQTFQQTSEHEPLDIMKKYFSITGDTDADEYIRRLAENRGYVRREIADPSTLIQCGDVQLTPGVCKALTKMTSSAKTEGILLVSLSGYRSPERQRQLFLGKLGEYTVADILAGRLDSRIDTILSRSSIPGYSHHHSGRAIDFACGDNNTLSQEFKNTFCYRWLAENDFENARAHNFIPNYPDDGVRRGPDPEPWEFSFSDN